MKSIKEIFNKEMVRVFKDKKMVFSVFFLPVKIGRASCRERV